MGYQNNQPDRFAIESLNVEDDPTDAKVPARSVRLWTNRKP